MRHHYLLALFAIAILVLGNSAGAGLIQNRDFTGSPVSAGSCNGCHSGGGFSPQPMIEILDNGIPVDMYVPGQTYQVKLTINTTGFPGGFGFQLVGLNSANQTGGTFGVAGNGTRTIMVNNREYFEHSRRATTNQFAISWTAPESGTGNINWFATGNAVNANGNTGGDVAGLGSFTIIEDTGVATSNTSLSRRLYIYPVPVTDLLNIDLADIHMEFNGLQIVDMQGRVVHQSNDLVTDLSFLPTGTYLCAVRLDNQIAVKRFLKL